MSNVIISTGSISRDFDVISPIFAIAGVEAKMFK